LVKDSRNIRRITMNDKIKNEITATIKERFNEFGPPTFNAMSIMEGYIIDNPGNVHLKVEDIQDIYFELRKAKQGLVQEIESKLRGTYVITAKSFNEETQEEIPAVYYIVTTEAKLLTDLSVNDKWSAEEVYNELKADKTFEELKASYN